MLVLDGPDIQVKNLKVEGALVVKAVPGAEVVIDGLAVSNAGWKWTSLEQVGNPVFSCSVDCCDVQDAVCCWLSASPAVRQLSLLNGRCRVISPACLNPV